MLSKSTKALLGVFVFSFCLVGFVADGATPIKVGDLERGLEYGGFERHGEFLCDAWGGNTAGHGCTSVSHAPPGGQGSGVGAAP